ncbi:ATP-binding cassette domain-containing protein [bacterium]|nr:ATP-binding cassette domain-containing protein [bacterium]
MIDVKNLVFQYPGSESAFALRGVSFQLRVGEWITLMGANGSGKTTLLQCLNGLLKPSSGEVLVDGFSTKENRLLFNIRQRVGMVFQNPDNQIVATTVIREIAFGLENLGVPRDEMEDRIEDALHCFHLESYRHTPPHLLSGGECQRLALASIWVMQPHYLILDEPTSLLDPQSRIEMFRLLQEIRSKREIGILFVTQFSEEALISDRLIIMDKGCMVMDDSPYTLFQRVDDLKRIGLGVPVDVELEQYIQKM